MPFLLLRLQGMSGIHFLLSLWHSILAEIGSWSKEKFEREDFFFDQDRFHNNIMNPNDIPFYRVLKVSVDTAANWT